MTHSDFIPYGRQSINEDDISSLVEALSSDFLTQGPKVTEFENTLAKKVQASHAVACNSATSALHLACLALGVGQGDWVWTTPNTFIASANCARYCQANVDFVDIDPMTYNLCAEQLAKKLAQAKQAQRLPKVVIPVHFAGQPCDMQAIYTLSKEYGFAIIEDASHAIGASYQETPIGKGQYSDICVFSFHPVKLITTAEGGIALTNNTVLANKMRTLCHQGTTKDESLLSHNPGDWYYEQHELGFNYRMSDLHAALGLSQLSRLEGFINRRHQLFSRYQELLADTQLQLPVALKDRRSALHLFPVLLPTHLKPIRKSVFNALRAAGIGTQVHYIPVHSQPYYQNLGFRLGDFPVAEDYYQRTMSLPLYPDLTDQQQDKVVAVLKAALEKYGEHSYGV
ncbi:UDP-4-amino-4,6-dideoxy-N-acetyl-beta-L-altrosamine transaminase [Marinomonas epiphytica]